MPRKRTRLVALILLSIAAAAGLVVGLCSRFSIFPTNTRWVRWGDSIVLLGRTFAKDSSTRPPTPVWTYVSLRASVGPAAPPLYVQMPDGKVLPLGEIRPEDVKAQFPNAPDLRLPNGFIDTHDTRFRFKGSRLTELEITNGSHVGLPSSPIGIGRSPTGPFFHFPAAEKQAIDVFGPPTKDETGYGGG